MILFNVLFILNVNFTGFFLLIFSPVNIGFLRLYKVYKFRNETNTTFYLKAYYTLTLFPSK